MANAIRAFVFSHSPGPNAFWHSPETRPYNRSCADFYKNFTHPTTTESDIPFSVRLFFWQNLPSVPVVHAKKLPTISQNCGNWSRYEKCPASLRITSPASGISSSIILPYDIGVSVSFSPQINSVEA